MNIGIMIRGMVVRRKKDELQKDTIYIKKRNKPNIILECGGDFRRDNADD